MMRYVFLVVIFSFVSCAAKAKPPAQKDFEPTAVEKSEKQEIQNEDRPKAHEAIDLELSGDQGDITIEESGAKDPFEPECTEREDCVGRNRPKVDGKWTCQKNKCVFIEREFIDVMPLSPSR